MVCVLVLAYGFALGCSHAYGLHDWLSDFEVNFLFYYATLQIVYFRVRLHQVYYQFLSSSDLPCVLEKSFRDPRANRATT